MSVSFTHPAVLWMLALLVPVVLVPLLARGRSAPARLQRAAGVRLGIVLALALALAGAQIVRAVDALTVVYVLDLSDSINGSERARAEEFIRESIGQMRVGDQAAVVAFGANALVERLAAEERSLPRIASVPVTTRSNLAAGVQLALALFPEDSRKRIVMLSDGQENAGRSLGQADLAAARGVVVDYVPLREIRGGAEAYLDRLELPANLRLGQRFDITVAAYSTVRQDAQMQLFAGGRLVKTLDVSLQPGTNQVRIPLEADTAGFQRYRAELQAAEDTLPQNNLAAGFAVVQGPPRILLVEGRPGEAGALAAALRAAQIDADTVAPYAVPVDLAGLGRYDAVFLVDVAAQALPPAAAQALPGYVRDLGRGLAMVGGPDSYGAGGYLRTPIEEALPVNMDVRNQEREPNLALVLAVDKSGSMGRCHCDDPSLVPGQYSPVLSGLPKVDIAKAAILQTYGVLGRLDFLGVLAFDQNAHWAVRLQQLVGSDFVQGAVGGMDASGQTNVYAGLNEAAQALRDVNARVKHVILVTDGWTQSGANDTLAEQMRREGITLSIIAAGRGSAPYLERLAQEGGGRYYPAEDIHSLPNIFVKETIQAAGRYIIEEPVYPLPMANSPILAGVAEKGLPGLRGYNGATAKDSATVVLASPDGDPLLAQWQYGLGRSVAWTSDLTGRWGSDWVAWEQFTRFAGQMAGWLLPEPSSSDLQVTVTTDGDRAGIDVDATDPAGRPWNLLQVKATVIGPDLVAQPVTLTQTAAGHYQGSAPATTEGTYLVQVMTARQPASATGAGSTTAGFVVPYSPEYRQAADGSGTALLSELAQATGGRALAEPGDAWAVAGPPARAARPLQPLLLLLAACLLPLDVAGRRLRWSASDRARLRAWLAAQWLRRIRRPAGAGATGRARQPELLGDLFDARERGRRRLERTVPDVRQTGQAELPAAIGAAADAPQEQDDADLPAWLKDRTRRRTPPRTERID